MLEQWQQEEIQELIGDFVSGKQTGYLSDSLNELLEGYAPIYYGDIIKEWQEMPSEYDNRGAAELGGEISDGIYHLMSLDLYLYYSDQVHTHAHEYAKENDIDLDGLG
jgi:hypothetical protein